MNKYRLLGLAGIPLALVGIVTSVALAAPKVPTAPATTTSQAVVAPSSTADTDVETNDDATVSAGKTSSDTDTETNDDATGAQEAPGVEQAD
ncbi:MAG: hypothetical protein JWL75_479 [Parcubacteria group bacterium]|nr:hypothetical protein [Parcubacteria group bacterium]